MKTRILLVDEHTLLRAGLGMRLSAEPDMEVVGQASDVRSALDLIDKLAPHVVLSGIRILGSDGVELTRSIRERHPQVRVLGVSGYASERRVLDMLEAGASGYVHKAARYAELLHGIRQVARGRPYVCPRLAPAVARARQRSGTLGPREREVVRLLAKGLRSAEIAATLQISENTVESHRRNILRKLGLRGIAELTRYAVREGLAPLDE